VSAAIVLAIVVATQNIDDDATEAMRATAAEAIGGEDSVVVREVEVPSDAEALRIERTVHARNVAQVVWLDTTHTRARVRVHVSDTGRWTERSITFSAVDTSVERGRALGFAVTSMLPEEALSARPHRPLPRPEPPPAGPTETESPDDLRTALRLGGIGSVGLGGIAGGVGGSIAGEFFVTPAVSVRIGFGGRSGAVPALAGTDLAGYAGVGGSFWPLPPGHNRRIAVGVRADALALYHSVSNNLLGDFVVRRQSKWLPGIDVLGEVALSLLPALEIIGSLGVEVAFGSTPLVRQQVIGDGTTSMGTPAEPPVGTLPVFRGVAEAGIRVSF
jgi:hypothetical protein